MRHSKVIYMAVESDTQIVCHEVIGDKFRSVPTDDAMQVLIDRMRTSLVTDDDIAYLATTLGGSGSVLSIPDGRFAADLASTGGPTSLSTLIGPLYLRAMGCCVPKLGVPGRPAGGVDAVVSKNTNELKTGAPGRRRGSSIIMYDGERNHQGLGNAFVFLDTTRTTRNSYCSLWPSCAPKLGQPRHPQAPAYGCAFYLFIRAPRTGTILRT